MKNKLPKHVVEQILNTNKAFKHHAECRRKFDAVTSEFTKAQDDVISAQKLLEKEQQRLNEILRSI